MIIYISDNGFFMGEHGLFNMMWMYEESQRVPLFVRWPDVVTPKTSTDHFVSMLDFGPTFLDVAGTIHVIPEDWRQEVFYDYTISNYDMPVHYGIRTHAYQLIRFPKLGSYEELFDLKKGPNELINVYDDSAYAKQREVLNIKLEKIGKRFYK